jgi:murein DD-endopeptidase MepM/ murein hydrolase activator NlpD
MILISRIFVLLGLGLAAVAGTRDSGLSVDLRARSYQPGEAILASVTGPALLSSLEIQAFDRSYPGFSVENGKRWHALVGIDLAAKPGKYKLQVVALDSGGKEVTALREITILPKSFPVRRLTVEEKYAHPSPADEERIASEQKRVEAIFAATSESRLWLEPFVTPVPGAPISSFGKRNIVNGESRSPHSGTDFQGQTGTPIKAPAGGRIVLAADLYYSGNTVILDHGLGMYSFMAHLSRISAREGALVQRGELIGLVGQTGRVTGPHLHWTLRLCRTRIDPLSLIEVLKHP